jgi:hypothetical protein
MFWITVFFIALWIFCGHMDQRRSTVPLDWLGNPKVPEQTKLEVYNPKKYRIRKCPRKRLK